MNLVIDEAVEECKTGEKNHIGMVVCEAIYLVHLSKYFDDSMQIQKNCSLVL